MKTLTIILVMCIFLIACGPTQVERDAQATQVAANIFATQTAEAPTVTPTPVPPTPTSTPVLPTPTPTAILASETPFTVAGFQLQITSVSLGNAMWAPKGMAEDETVLTVEFKVLSGDPKVVGQSEGEFDVWVTDESERMNSTRTTTSTLTAEGEIRAIQWLFGVPEGAEALFLNFPGGVTVDLSPMLS